MDIYQFKVKDMKQEEVSLDKYKGKVLMVMNTATECSFTPQYRELQKMYVKYKERGFEILDFPCNQFGEQAPGTSEQINNFCLIYFGIRFEQFAKIDVNGAHEAPLFTYLKSQTKCKGFDDSGLGKILDEMLSLSDPDYVQKNNINWNFTKFIIDREGNVVGRYEPTTDIKEIERVISEYV